MVSKETEVNERNAIKYGQVWAKLPAGGKANRIKNKEEKIRQKRENLKYENCQ